MLSTGYSSNPFWALILFETTSNGHFERTVLTLREAFPFISQSIIGTPAFGANKISTINPLLPILICTSQRDRKTIILRPIL